MRKIIVAGNWKMSMTSAKMTTFAEEIKKEELSRDVEVVICPSFLYLDAAKKEFKGSDFKIGAQNAHYELEGAYTGEVSVSMLEELNMDYCIIGHSERRQYFNETDETVNLKIKSLLSNSKMIPILCVGESLEEREKNKQSDVVTVQITKAFAGLNKLDIYADSESKVVIAYEPIWAIGTGKTATSEQADEMCGVIRSTMAKLYDDELANAVSILYGGSVNPGNIVELMSKDHIDGALVGGASLNPVQFAQLINFNVNK